MFKSGDKIKRVSETVNVGGFHIVRGQVYTVVSHLNDRHGTGSVTVAEAPGVTLSASRFELVNALGTQIGGKHYKNLKIQPVEYIMANNIGFMEGNVIKYVTRYSSKNGIEDLKKAKHYIEMLIEHKEKNNG